MIEALIARLRAQLIDDWAKAHKMLSVWLSAAGAAGSAAWLVMTDLQKAELLSLLGIERPAFVTLVGFLAIALARLKKQASVSGEA